MTRNPHDMPIMTPAAEKALEATWKNDDEAHKLLDLINAEFVSDPMSVQCFDLRVVDRVKVCVAERKVIEKNSPWLSSLTKRSP